VAEAAAAVPSGFTVEQAVRTRAFVLLWCVLLLNVTAGLGVLGQAAAMVQEVFDGMSAETASLFVATLSLFNMGGRLVWAALSDRLRRRATYALFFSLGPPLYAARPPALRGRAPRRRGAQPRPVRGVLRAHPQHVRRRLRQHARVRGRPVRLRPRGRDPRARADRALRGGGPGADARELPARALDR